MNPNDMGESVETPPASQAEIITPESSDDVNASASNTVSPEEVAWNNLKGGTQDRIKDILNERDRYKAEAEKASRTAVVDPGYRPVTDLSTNSPQVRDAVQQLSNVGIATKQDVDNVVSQQIGNLVYNFELEKLENRHDGADGLPKFDRSEYQDYVNRNPQYRNYVPEDVYEKMYSEEILDARAKSYKPTSGKSGQSNTSSLRPNRTTVREEQWTVESIEKRMLESDGKEWYRKNIPLVNKVLASQNNP